jgi:hypothetical protein
MQVWHGTIDTTLYPQNFWEEIKQWTNVYVPPFSVQCLTLTLAMLQLWLLIDTCLKHFHAGIPGWLQQRNLWAQLPGLSPLPERSTRA